MASFGRGYPPGERLVFGAVERLMARRSPAVCAVGVDLGAQFVRIGVPADRVHVVRSGVPLPATDLADRAVLRRHLCEELGVPQDRPLLLYVGSLEKRKNVVRLADLLNELGSVTARPSFLLVLGEGPERRALTARIADLGLECAAHLAGHIAEPVRVLDYMRAADVLLLLSSAEGLPQVLVQAAAVGTPFVAYNVAGVGEMLRLGARGEAVPLGDLQAAVTATARVLERPDQYGGEPVADLSSWSPDTIRREYGRVLDDVLRVSRCRAGPDVANLS
jgi:glycosyltransferase involved in cell wall biosynthesis